MRKIKINIKIVQYIFIFLMIIVAFSRGFYETIFINSSIEIAILSVSFLCSFIYYLLYIHKCQMRTKLIICFVLLTILLLLTASEITSTIIFNIYAIFAFLFLINDWKLMRFSLELIIFLSIIFSVVSWISLVLPSIYITKILPFLNDSALEGNITDLYYGKLCGLTDHYSRNAFYVVLGIIISVATFLTTKTRKSKIIHLIIIAFLLSTLFIIGKRGHSLFLALSLMCTLMIINNNLSKKINYIFKTLIIGSGLLLLFSNINTGSQNLFARLFDNSGDISTGRFDLYKSALNMFYQKPFLGNGYNAFSKTVYGFAGVHNDYIQLLCENGILGLLIMLLANISIYIITIIMILRFRKKKELKLRQEFKGLVISFMFQTFYLMYAVTGLPHYDYEIFIFYFLFSGVSVGIHREYSLLHEYN